MRLGRWEGRGETSYPETRAGAFKSPPAWILGHGQTRTGSAHGTLKTLYLFPQVGCNCFANSSAKM